MPRKSAAALAFPVHSTGERLKPPPGLTKPERELFLDIVASTKPGHFQTSDMPLLCAYCRACALEVRSARADDAKALPRWEKAVKAMTCCRCGCGCHRKRVRPTTPHAADRTSECRRITMSE